jgi:hypothetical protein
LIGRGKKGREGRDNGK